MFWHCYCVIVCVCAVRMNGPVCIVPMCVPNVEAGEWPVVPKVKLGKQRETS